MPRPAAIAAMHALMPLLLLYPRPSPETQALRLAALPACVATAAVLLPGAQAQVCNLCGGCWTLTLGSSRGLHEWMPRVWYVQQRVTGCQGYRKGRDGGRVKEGAGRGR